MASLLSLDSGKRPITRESIMVLNGAIDTEELTLMPVDGYETTNEDSYKSDGSASPFFIFGDDDDFEDEEDFEDEDDDFEDEDDDFEDEDELDEDEDDDDDEDEDDDFEEEDDDFEDEDEDFDDDFEE
jgi:hypothetical protein